MARPDLAASGVGPGIRVTRAAPALEDERPRAEKGQRHAELDPEQVEYLDPEGDAQRLVMDLAALCEVPAFVNAA